MIFLAKVIKKTVLELEINYTLPCLPPKLRCTSFPTFIFFSRLFTRDIMLFLTVTSLFRKDDKSGLNNVSISLI